MNKEDLVLHIQSVIFDKSDQSCTHDNSCSDPMCCYQSTVGDCDICMIEIAVEETIKTRGQKGRR